MWCPHGSPRCRCRPRLEAELCAAARGVRPAQRADRGVGTPAWPELEQTDPSRGASSSPCAGVGPGSPSAAFVATVDEHPAVPVGAFPRSVPRPSGARVSAVRRACQLGAHHQDGEPRGCGGCWSRRRGAVLRSTSDENRRPRSGAGRAKGLPRAPGQAHCGRCAGAPAGPAALRAVKRDKHGVRCHQDSGGLAPVAVAPRPGKLRPAPLSPASHPPFSGGETPLGDFSDRGLPMIPARLGRAGAA